MTRSRCTLAPSLAALCTLLLALPRPSEAQDALFEVVDLGALDSSYPSSYPYALNDRGQVAGVSATLEPNSVLRPIAFLYGDGVMNPLHPLSQNYYSWAYGLNDDGDVVGALTPPGIPGPPRAFLYRAGALQDLQPLLPADASGSWATGINESNQIVGRTGGVFATRAFLLDHGGFVDVHEELRQYLGDPSPYLATGASAINTSGEVVGSLNEGATWTAFSRSPDGTYDLLVPPPGGESQAACVNDAGQVAGAAGPSDAMHAVIWRGASVEDLGTLGDGTHSAALGINSQGDVVGVSDTGDYTCPSACFPVQHAFLYREGVMRDLNDLIPVDSGWELVVATAINDSGQIVASGRDAAGWNRALLLNPSPSGRIQGLIDLVISFDLPKGPENSLVTKLEHALASLEGGDSQTACSQLGAFINEVRAQSGNKLTTEQADELIADATAIRALLGCS